MKVVKIRRVERQAVDKPPVEESEPVFIELADALELYAAIIGGTTGQAADQLRDSAGKRLALVSMLTFLEVNGYEVNATDPELADWIIGLSAGTTPNDRSVDPAGWR